MGKISTGVTAIGLSLCLASVAAMAAPPRGGGRPGGGGAPHVGGGAPHFGGGAPHIGGGARMGGGAPHFGGGMPHIGGGARMGGGVPHFGGARIGGGVPHFGGARMGGMRHFAPRVAAHAGPHFAPRGAHLAPHFAGHATPRFGRAAPRFTAHSHLGAPTAHTTIHGRMVAPHVGRVTPGNAHRFTANGHTFAPSRAAVGPRHFGDRRQFAANGAFRGAFHPFWNHGWHPHHHLGWIGPLFWPYAYGDIFYDALWPDDYGYDDPFWAYGYGDIYAGIFAPNTYDEYVQGPGAPAKMAQLTRSMAQSCADEAAEVTGWPIDQIQAAVAPNADQGALLDDLGNAVVKASDVITSHCPTTVSFTPTGRLDDMQQRLQGMVQAVDIISPPLSKFYDSLSDEQKARFNAIRPQGSTASKAQASQNADLTNPQTACGASPMAWPTDQINQVVQPNDAQRAKLEALQAAAGKAADLIKASCPTETPNTPPARLAAIGKHLQAMLAAVETIRPPLHDFYDSLSDSQKARFNTMGKQLFAANKQ